LNAHRKKGQTRERERDLRTLTLKRSCKRRVEREREVKVIAYIRRVAAPAAGTTTTTMGRTFGSIETTPSTSM
jgi:hypothetical protein